MSMDFFRKGSRSVFTFLIFGIIILTFIFWGVGGDVQRSSTVLTEVNGEPISFKEFQRIYSRQLEAYGQLMGQGRQVNKNLEQFIEKRVATDLISRKLLSQQARQLGIVIGREDILASLREIEAFHDPELKKFSPRIYQLVLEANDMTPKQFEDSIQEQLEASRYNDILNASILASTQALKDRAFLNEYAFDLSTASFTSESMRKSGKLNLKEPELRAFFEERKAEFLTDEKRVLEIARFNIFDYQNSWNPTDEAVESFFKQNIQNSEDSKWSEKRAHALHILISDKSAEGRKQIQKIKADLEREKAKLNPEELESFFRDLAKRESEDFGSATKGGDLGYFNETAMVKPFGEAVFSEKNKLRSVLGPVESDFGFHLIFVLDRTSGEKTLSNRKNEIQFILSQEAAAQKTKELEDWVNAKISRTTTDPAPWFTENSFTKSLTSPLLQTDRDGLIPSNLLQAAFEAPAEQWQQALKFDDELFVFRVQSIVPPSPQTFEEARARIENQMIAERTQKIVDEVYEKVSAGELRWEQLPSYGTSIKTEKSVKAFQVDQVPGFDSSDTLLRSLQTLTEKEPVTKPILTQGKWVLMKAENFKKPNTEVLAERKNLETEAITAQRGSLFEAHLEELMKSAKIPKDFREKYGI